MGIKYWGGGAFCADNSYKRMSVIKGESYPGDLSKVGEREGRREGRREGEGGYLLGRELHG